MKTTLPLILSLLLPLFGYSQTTCAEMLAAARKSEQAGQFRDAILKYNAAKVRCGASNVKEIDERVLGVFDRIEGLREQAEAAEQKAKAEAEKAEKAKEDLEKALAEIKAQKEATDSVLLIVKAEQEKNERIIGALDFYEGRYGLAVKVILDSTHNFVNQYGFIDKQGNVKINYEFEEARPFDREIGFAEVRKNGQLFLLDTLGNLVPLAKQISNITSHIKALDLRNQGISTIPEVVFSSTQLECLFLNRNNLQIDNAPFEKLQKLKILSLSDNNLTTLPKSISKLRSLKQLNLSFNQFSSIPESIFEIHQLQSLDISSNSLKEIPEELSQLKHLRYLDIGFNNLSNLPNCISQLKKLKYLEVRWNAISSIPSFLIQLKNLETLNLSFNQLTSLSDSIFELDQLKEFLIRGNNINFSNELLASTCNPVFLDAFHQNLIFQINSIKLDSTYSFKRELYVKIYNLNKHWYSCDFKAISKNLLTVMSFLAGSSELFSGNFEASERIIREGIYYDPTYQKTYTILPFSILFQGKVEEAKLEFLKWKDKVYDLNDRETHFKFAFFAVFRELEKLEAIPPHLLEEVENIKKLLQE